MDLKTKLLIILESVIIVGLIFLIGYKQIQLSESNLQLKGVTEQKELAESIVRSQSSLVSKKDLEDFAAKNNANLDVIKQDLEKLSAKLVAVNVVKVNSVGQKQNNIPSTSNGETNPSPTTEDRYGYLKLQQNLLLFETFQNTKVPLGQVGFSAWQKDPWSLTLHPREYKVVNVIGTDENNKTYVYNRFTISVDNKEYDIKVSKSETKTEMPTAKFTFFNPKLFLTAGGGINVSEAPVKASANIGLSLGLMSYGKFKTNPDISILHIGAGYQSLSERPNFHLNPINFNVGKLIPGEVVSNTYVGPTIQVDTKGSIYTGLNISVGL